MRELAKQDRTYSRRAIDTEKKYKLGQIELTAEEVERLKSEMVVDQHLSTSSSNAIANRVVTEALNNKVTKEAGKGLSTNDFTDEHKDQVHTHDNKTVLDNIKKTDIDGWNKKADVLDVYPLGSVYMNDRATNPSTLFGGTWEQIENTVFTNVYLWKRIS